MAKRSKQRPGSAGRRPNASPNRLRVNQPTGSRGRAPSRSPGGWASKGPAELATTLVYGLPGWALLAGGLIWLVMVAMWVTGATNGGFAVFLGTLLCAAIGTGWLATGVARGKEPLRAMRAVGVMVLSVAVPVVFDPHAGDVFNLPKYTVSVIGALALAGLWVVGSVHHREVPRWRNGLQWAVAALVGWTAISAVTGLDLRVSLLGNYDSYDGLYLAAAAGVIMMTAAEAFDADDVRKVLAAVAFCGGTVVVVYGLIQLPGTLWHGAHWDFINWHNGSFSNQIFSTFANPNHLGGYLAMVLPAVLVLGLGAKRWPWRAAGGVMAVAVLVELARTEARGAWVGAIVSLLALAAFLAKQRRVALALSGAGAFVFAAFVGVTASGGGFLHLPGSSLFRTGGTSTVQQRADIWAAAVRMAIDHPLTGTGPDTFALVYPRYETSAWVKGLGPNYLVNGAHNIFMNILADQGPIGLLLWLALLAYLGLRFAGARRRLRAIETDENVGPVPRERARSTRACLAIVAASIVAYVVQAAFNVQQVGLTFVFWALAGLLASLALGAGTPDTLQPAKLLAVDGADEQGRAHAPAGARPSPAPAYRGTKRRWRRADYGRYLPVAVAAVATVGAVVLLALGTDAPYRADHDYWAAYKSIAPNPSSSAPTPVGPVYFGDMGKTFSLNPWEPVYRADEATVYNGAAQHASNLSQAVSDLTNARALLQHSVTLEPLWGPYQASESQVDLELAQLQPSDRRSDLAAAARLARKAISDSPRDSSYRTLLSKILATPPTAPPAHKAATKS